MRDKLIHHYFGVDYEAVYETIRQDLPVLKRGVRRILKETTTRDSVTDTKRTGKDPDISQKYARKTARFGSRENESKISIYLLKYAQILPHIMPIIGS
jgi:hypothetical protein